MIKWNRRKKGREVKSWERVRIAEVCNSKESIVSPSPFTLFWGDMVVSSELMGVGGVRGGVMEERRPTAAPQQVGMIMERMTTGTVQVIDGTSQRSWVNKAAARINHIPCILSFFLHVRNKAMKVYCLLFPSCLPQHDQVFFSSLLRNCVIKGFNSRFLFKVQKYEDWVDPNSTF